MQVARGGRQCRRDDRLIQRGQQHPQQQGPDDQQPPPLVHGLRRPVRRLIFLAALLPKPGLTANQQRATEQIDGLVPPQAFEFSDLGNNVWSVGPNTARELFFSDVPEEVAGWAFERLRPQCYNIFDQVTPLEAWPDVASSVIACREDRSFNPAWFRTAAKERLGIEAVEIAGGHSPFLSRPVELAALIDSLL